MSLVENAAPCLGISCQIRNYTFAYSNGKIVCLKLQAGETTAKIIQPS